MSITASLERVWSQRQESVAGALAAMVSDPLVRVCWSWILRLVVVQLCVDDAFFSMVVLAQVPGMSILGTQ